MKNRAQKLIIVGLDCAVPRFVFEDWRDSLPNLTSLTTNGCYGIMRSCDPPITVPAWSVMMSGRDPGELGIYGFRNRKDYSYDGYMLADARAVKAPRVWDRLSEAGKQVILLGVPQTYPIKPLRGCVISDFLAPSTDASYTHPASLKEEIAREVGEYFLDVENFRTDDKSALLQRIYAAAGSHFAAARYLLRTKPWDFFMMVEMGTDRIHHGFWSLCDPLHRKYKPGNPYETAIRDFYRYCDGEIGKLLEFAEPGTPVMVVSDHGARRMQGGICVNDWLIQQGLLVLEEQPEAPIPIGKARIDWSRTRAWGDGGYYGRIFLNVEGREPRGIVKQGEYEGLRRDLIKAIVAIADPDGRPIGSTAYRPEDLYREVRGVPPDLIAYFGNLDWRSVGTVGSGRIHTFENDTGPDEANHDWPGLFILNQPGCRLAGLAPGYREDLRILDVAPTILNIFGLKQAEGGWLARLHSAARRLPKFWRQSGLALLLLLALETLDPSTVAHAYVGPGAGFAFVSSFLTLLAGFLLGLFYLVTSPIRLLLKALIRGRGRGKSGVQRVVIVGLDGMDPQVAERYMDQGELPNFRTLARLGGFARLATSYPAVSPVAWSSFMTGVDASHHNIFDFVTRDPNTYEPMLSSASVRPPRRTLRIGRWRIPLGSPRIVSYRRSRSFWSILGDHGIFSTVIRVPITFPVERFRGVLLAGMCVPDLRGSQGTYSFYTTDGSTSGKSNEGTTVVERVGKRIDARILGPENSIRKSSTPLSVHFSVEIDEDGQAARLQIDGQTLRLEARKHSPWVRVNFKAGLGIRVSGICRFYLKTVTPHFQLYVTPVQIDPQRPALPLSHPATYSMYLSRLLGRFATLGLAEDTTAVNQGVLDAEGFLEQAYLYQEERERMFFDALEKTRDGLCVCVFDVTDRVQHMFFRTLEDEASGGASDDAQHGRETIRDLYVRMDRLVGRVMEKLGTEDVLLVMSDHGFAPFRRGVNLNTWLYQNGYLALKSGASESGEWLREVDWTRTKAFSLGLAGIFVNRRGREAQGIVGADGDLSELRRELARKLAELVDPETGSKAVTRVIETEKAFPGPYAQDGPDLLVCFRRGYRVSWEGASGKVTGAVFEANDRAWSGDHCMDPELVPGVLFSNRKLTSGKPDIKDIAPTVLSLFGVPIPAYMKGKPVVDLEPDQAAHGKRGTA